MFEMPGICDDSGHERKRGALPDRSVHAFQDIDDNLRSRAGKPVQVEACIIDQLGYRMVVDHAVIAEHQIV